MQFVDLAAQQNLIRDKIETNIQAVLSHGKYIMGPEIKELEERLAEFVGVEHGIACSSGTDALLLALMTYDVGPGDAVFTSPFTFIATAEVISLLGATPVFVDIDPKTFNIDPKSLERAIAALQKGSSDYPLPSITDTSSTPKGIIAVDLFGLPADYDAINSIAKKHGLFVIEDAAQSFGAEYKGKRACSLADIACTSFFPAKPLGCYGDGGMCFTGDENLAQTMRSLSVHGQGHHKYENVRIGINGRLDTLQAAILHAKFDIFPKEIELRQEAFNATCSLRISVCLGPIFNPRKGFRTALRTSEQIKGGWHSNGHLLSQTTTPTNGLSGVGLQGRGFPCKRRLLWADLQPSHASIFDGERPGANC
jgi:dTDP-4-amino-4,6-dideoxygalactose transaminase